MIHPNNQIASESVHFPAENLAVLSYLHCSSFPGQHFRNGGFNHKGDKGRVQLYQRESIHANGETSKHSLVTGRQSTSNIKTSRILFTREEDSSYWVLKVSEFQREILLDFPTLSTLKLMEYIHFMLSCSKISNWRLYLLSQVKK